MYKIIGADGKEYGPITTDQLKQWIAEGRVNAQTRVLPDGATDWKSLSEIPELAACLPIAPLAAPASQPGSAPAAEQVKGPAIGLIVTGILNVLLSAVRVVAMATGFGLGAFNSAGRGGQMDKLILSVAGTTGIVIGSIGIIIGGLIIYSGFKMQKLESYGLCMIATILALLPCTSPCCVVGIPVGIWGLIVLSKAEVKGAFH